MRKFKQNKLWRDKIIDMMEREHGSKMHWRRLDDNEFDAEIRVKLIEEVQEVVSAQDKDNLIEELADLYEVVDAIAGLHAITKEEIAEVQAKKREDRGSFSGRCFVEVAEHQEGGLGEKYCLADPEKYPEIID